MKVTWKASDTLAKYPASSYFLQVKQNNKSRQLWQNCTTPSTFCDAGVLFDYAYSIRLKAANDIGYGEFSECKLSVIANIDFMNFFLVYCQPQTKRMSLLTCENQVICR